MFLVCGRVRSVAAERSFGSLGPYGTIRDGTAPLRDVMVVVYNGHGERGPEGRVVTFVRPFVAVVLIFDKAMLRNLGGSVTVRGGELVETEDDGVREMR